MQMVGFSDTGHRCARSPGACRHFLPIVRIAADWQIDPAARLHHAPHQRDVLLVDLAIVKLPRQRVVRGVILGDDHHARGALVQAVDDPRPELATNSAQIRDVVHERVDQGA